jgi:hypothetical protein
LAWLTLLPTDGCFLQYAQCLIGFPIFVIDSGSQSD